MLQTPLRHGLTGVRGVSAGFAHTCAFLTDGTVQCWGANSHGQLGNANSQGTSPTAVQGLTGTVKMIATGEFHTCALMTDGTVECWGLNNNGQLGATSCSDLCPPTAVPGASGVSAIALGTFYTCAVLSTGSVECWGSGNYGLLGNRNDHNELGDACANQSLTLQEVRSINAGAMVARNATLRASSLPSTTSEADDVLQGLPR